MKTIILAVSLFVATVADARHINNAGLKLIEEFEGFRANFYLDPVGIKTIGYGHACHVHDCSNIHPPISQAQGEQLLKSDVATFENCVQSMFPQVDDNKFAALVSFSFNLGCNALRTSDMANFIRAGKYGSAAAEFGLWVHAGGKVLPGLVRRRNAEKALFCQNGCHN